MKKYLTQYLFLLLLIGNCTMAQTANIKWIVPDEVDYATRGYDTEKPELAVKIDVSLPANIKVETSQIKLYRNGKRYGTDGAKLGTTPIKQTKTGEFRIQQTLQLLEGRNEWRVEVNLPNQIVKSTTMVINWNAGKPNLYILCVGVASNLLFTRKDAEAICNQFRTQEGHLFGKVEPVILVCEEKTTFSYLGNILENLRHKDIRKQDVLMVFFSSHGTPTQNGFGVITSDKLPSGTQSKYSTLDYQKDIVDNLDEIVCKKILLFDACYSGGPDSGKGKDMAQMQDWISNTPPSIVTLSSSNGTEKSYEDAKWQHGAFTQAILEGLKGLADKSKDDTITMQELADYVISVVPPWVAALKNHPLQHPRLIKPIEYDYPIFNYKRKNNNLPELIEKCDDGVKPPTRPTEPPFSKNRLAVIGLNPANAKAFDFESSSIAKGVLEEKSPQKYTFTSNPQASKIAENGAAQKLLGGDVTARKLLPPDLQADYLIILKRTPTTYRQDTEAGHTFWVATTTITYYKVSVLTGETIDSNELSANGADSDKKEAEKRAIERSLASLD